MGRAVLREQGIIDMKDVRWVRTGTVCVSALSRLLRFFIPPLESQKLHFDLCADDSADVFASTGWGSTNLPTSQ